MEATKLNSDETKVKEWRKREIVTGFKHGMIRGTEFAIFALFLLSIWLLLFPPINYSFPLLIAIVWIGYGIVSTLYYKLLPCTVYRDFAFFVGLFVAIELMNYIYGVLAYNMNLPYNSLEIGRTAMLVVIGTGLGLAAKMIKIMLRPKRVEIKETSQ